VAKPGVEVVLFDLGGVLAEFGGLEPMQRLSGIGSDDELWHRWLNCRWVSRFERGECPPEEFAAGLVADWNLAVSPGAFLSQFSSWSNRPLAGAQDLVSETRRSVTVGCLSNTNTIHWQSAASWPLMGLFDHQFLSFQLGRVKPDPEVFEQVCSQLGTDPGAVLFIDDNPLNVEGGLRVGLQAVRAKGVDEARQALVAVGVIEASLA